MKQLPAWVTSLMTVGEKFATVSSEHSDKRITIALCLPRFDYAAAFLGIGVLKRIASGSFAKSEIERMESLLGKWVTCGEHTGILDWCSVEKTYQIKVHVDKTTTAFEEIESWRWARVRPAGREFNPDRRLSDRQTQKVRDRNLSIQNLSNLLRCDLWEAAMNKSGRLITIYGNKTRLSHEISESIVQNEEACLERVLRPEGHADYGEYTHCSFEANRSPVIEEDGALVIIEAGRSLSDQLATSRNLNRVVLLGRNTTDYDACAGQLIEASTLRRGDVPEMDIQLPPSIRHLTFFHK